MRAFPLLVWACLALAACSASKPPIAETAAPAALPKPSLSPQKALAEAREAFAKSDYGRAQTLLETARSATGDAAHTEQSALLLARVLAITGRYDEALELLAPQHTSRTLETKLRAVTLSAELLRKTGRLAEAENTLQQVSKEPRARGARLLLGEILLEQGRREAATAPLMTLIEDYNESRIDPGDGSSLALVGRAAHLLRSPHDANDAFNEAERIAPVPFQTLLYRAELFLEKYDPGHAEQVLSEILEQAPHHPEANVWMAEVRLVQAMDFDAAERLANQALSVNPKLSRAFFVLAGIALRDMELERADAALERGLGVNPRDLELLSLRGAVRFLADDATGFSEVKTKVLELNPEYTGFFRIVADYADWEHRYDEIVKLMREAIAIDGDDAHAYAQLGLNLIRAGEEKDGLSALRRAFAKDPFNVRVFNTLNLYEKTILKHYESVPGPRFTIRYPKDERAILERYVPKILDQAYDRMKREYGYEPELPVIVELYAERQSFAIRTSGLPQTAIQGVCFGRTMATLTPKGEPFNLGMTLFHELSHVFHIQLSKSHVPRWFTEGLAEYETLSERPEWAREHDPELFQALRDGRLPKVANMSRAFTRAEKMSDVATAYYAASQILVMLVERYGMEKMARMLELWSAGVRTESVIERALGISAEKLDQDFRKWLSLRLDRYHKQFVPLRRSPPLDAAKIEAEKAPKNPEKQVALALALFQAGKGEAAEAALKTTLALAPEHLDANFLATQSALSKKDLGRVRRHLDVLLNSRGDGYETRLVEAEWLTQTQGPSAARPALEAAHRFDPSQAEPLARLAELARGTSPSEETRWLEKLALLAQHEPPVYRRLLELLVQQGQFERAIEVGEAAIHADMNGLETHLWFGRALAEKADLQRAAFEFESATLSPGPPAARAEAHRALAEVQTRLGRALGARANQKRAAELAAEAASPE